MTWNSSRLLAALGLVGSLVAANPALGQEPLGRLPEPIRTEAYPDSPYVTRVWTADDGLPVNGVNAIEQTRDGYLWFGTFGGLVRFDGVEFRTYTSAEHPGLGDDRVVSLHEDAAGTLWIGTLDRGVYRLHDGRFDAPGWAAALPNPLVWAFHEGADGTLWVRTGAGAARISTGGEVAIPDSRDDELANPTIAVLESGDEPFLLGGYAGEVAAPPGANVRSISLGEWAGTEARAVVRDAAGTVWVGTQHLGLLRLAGDRLERAPLTGAPEGYAAVALLPDPEGGLWVGTDGAGLFHLQEGHMRPFALDDAGTGQSIRVLYRDREGNLWVGTNGEGLYRLTPRSVAAHVPAEAPRLSFVPVVGDGAGGLWAGAACGGLVHYRDGIFERYTEVPGLPIHCIWSLHRDVDGSLWVAIGRGGVLRVRDGGVTRLSTADGLDGNHARAILRDRAGSLWIGTESAVNRVAPDGRVTAYRLPVQPASVTALAERQTGGLWVGSRVGLFRWLDGTFTRWGREDGLSPGAVRALLEDADGTLWVGTYGGGLSRMRDGHIRRYTTADGLHDMFLSHILDDGRGRLWMSSNRGVFHVTRGELDAVAAGRAVAVTSVWFDGRDGMPISEAAGGGQPAGWRAPDGRLWFPTVNGLAEFDPAVPRNPHPPPVHISRVIVDRRSRVPGERLELPAGTHSLEIHYAGLSFRAPEKVRFRYRLEGYDEAWIDAGARRAAYYTSLPPGRYRFQVRARNEDGVWSEVDAALSIRQVPFFYQTPWFWGLAAALLLAVTVTGHRLRMRGLVRRAQRLEAAVTARTAEVVEHRDRLAEQHRTVQEAHERIRKAHGDLLAILDQTGVGVCLIDGAGRVEFLNDTAQQVLGSTTASAAGRPWQDVLPLSGDYRQRAEALLVEASERRTRVPVRLDTADRRRYWIELDARDDPRDLARRILYLYDVTELYDLHGLVGGAAPFQGMVGETAAMRLVYRQIRDVAAVDSMVVLEGETGTGKELAARAIHELSARKGRPYVAVNCAGLTESLLSSQLFGHRRGAFTGAVADQVGLFEAANGGTLLLDEVGDIPPSVQASLLRVLQEGEITRVGESRPRKIDVRVVAATHRNLEAEVAAGRFRQDLYYRLRVARIRIPPLRERRDDIPLLVAWFLAQARASDRIRVHEVSREAMELLRLHPWPGNVRELRGVIESSALAARGPMIEVTDLPVELLAPAAGPPPAPASPDGAFDSRQRRHIELALERTHGNRAAAARLLGISRRTFYRRLREFELDR
ncbi:MAG: sigma 54-interacting transcriptional regulator [Thermoanaerobaculia bacterium]